jgi:hypothetical protein
MLDAEKARAAAPSVKKSLNFFELKIEQRNHISNFQFYIFREKLSLVIEMVFSMKAENDAQQFGIGTAGNTIQN